MSEKQVRSLVKSCASHGKVCYKSVHDFRKAGVELHMRRLKSWSKEQLVEAIMQFVNEDPKLNPTVQRNGVLTPKYVPNRLMNRQQRWLINQYITQLYGHSRNDKMCPYKRSKK
ncbi:hypothetical protein BK120_19785 [Paenibacillus sp. FSL A5-0031]|nr:hypothetical protein BK120_19785 [Paenibacillus sp. FSL A5-0031]